MAKKSEKVDKSKKADEISIAAEDVLITPSFIGDQNIRMPMYDYAKPSAFTHLISGEMPTTRVVELGGVSSAIVTGHDYAFSYKTEKEIELERNITELQAKLSLATKNAKKSQKEKQQIEKDYLKLKKFNDLKDVLNRVSKHAKNKLENDNDFALELSKETMRAAFVLSIDIRRSTDL